MKSYRLLIFSVLALGLAAVGCHKSPRVVAITKSQPTGPVELKVKWPAGRYGVQSQDMKTTLEMTIPGVPQPIIQETTVGTDTALKVVPGSGAGKGALEMEVLRTRMSIATTGQPTKSFDSTKSRAGDPNPAAASIGKVIGGKVRFGLDASNRVESVEGAEALQQRMIVSKNDDPAGTVKNMFSAEILKLEVDFARNLADKPVQVGDTWPVQIEYPMGALGSLVMQYTFTLSGWEKHNDRWCAKIDMDGTFVSKPGEAGGAGGITLNFHEGKCTGESWFDLDMGMFERGTDFIDAKVDIIVPNPNGRKADAAKTMAIKGSLHEEITSKFELQ